MSGTETSRVGVVGLGYVGLPLALALTDAGYEVVGVDVDAERVESIRCGTSYVTDIEDAAVEAALTAGFRPTTDYGELTDVEAVVICVPTPMRKTGAPDLSYVAASVDELADVIPRGCTVILESTVYPGATREVVAGRLTENGWTVGEDVFVAFSPERIDPGNTEYATTEIPKVYGGVTDACGDRVQALYEPVFDEIIRVDSATEAEFVKLLENTFRIVNIGFINELAQIADRLDIDIWNVIDAAATKPFGFMPFYPGPGLGGHCIPVDPMYLSWRANQQGIETRFIDLAKQVNREMPSHVVSRVTELLNADGVPLPEADVLVVGVAYKADVSDTRESPAFDIMNMLEERGVEVSYHDPYVPVLEVRDQRFESVPLEAERIAGADCVVIVTDHSDIDVDSLVSNASLVFDTRNVTSEYDADHVHRL